MAATQNVGSLPAGTILGEQEVMGLLKAVGEFGERASWKLLGKDSLDIPTDRDPTAESYTGTVGDWSVSVLSLSAQDPLFPGERRYGGIALKVSKPAKMICLTPELAESLFKLAVKKNTP